MAEAQPARNIPTQVLNPQPGQPPQREHLYQPLSTERLQFLLQQKYASPSAYYASYTQPLPEYAPQTQPPPEYVPHTQPLPEYASCTQQSPENTQQGYSAQLPAYEFITARQEVVQAPQRRCSRRSRRSHRPVVSLLSHPVTQYNS